MFCTSNRQFYIGTTRFNNESWRENKRWRENNGFKGCIYNTPVHLAKHIRPESDIFVLEMNNDKPNRIMGIGLIQNHSYRQKEYAYIYSRGNYNRYTYKGSFRLDVENMTEEEKEVIKKLEDIVFKGKGHLKRGQGIIMVPLVRLEKYKAVYGDFFNRIISGPSH
jgi:hypothetical protein